MIVVDACAWVRSLVDAESRGDAARAVLGADRDWALPAHAPVEVLRTLRRYEDRGLVTTSQARHHAGAVGARLARYVQPTPGLIDQVWSWRDRVAMYDAPYVHLAAELGVALVTVDERLARAARALGVETIVPGAKP